PFSEIDDGADLVETALLLQGLLIAKQYFDSDAADEIELRRLIADIWRDVEWDWFSAGEDDGLYWHWSRNHGFKIGMKIQGFNECLIVYALAMASPTHPISEKTYQYWQSGPGYETRTVGGRIIEAAFPEPGPLFFTHYSFIGLNPHLLADGKVGRGYFNRNAAQVLSNREYCLYAAPKEYGYGPRFWGLTASLIPNGYTANAPDNDTGTVAPTAALASMPYVPFYSYQVLAALLRAAAVRPDTVWSDMGPVDAINKRDNWLAEGHLAIDQLPIVCMVENYRSGLLWKLFMRDPDVGRGLRRAGMRTPAFSNGFAEANQAWQPDGAGGYQALPLDLLPHPIVCMVENYRSGLLWKLFMRDPDVGRGLRRAGMRTPAFSNGFAEANQAWQPDGAGGYQALPLDLLPHPDRGRHELAYWRNQAGQTEFLVTTADDMSVCIVRTWSAAGANRVGVPLPATADRSVYRLRMVDTDSAVPVRLR
ncbi:MAG: hypothetical protein LIP23_02210, partial [Planctomycetes bacterium]|nr:hypothetical protein [Planctomycetota bacterium]